MSPLQLEPLVEITAQEDPVQVLLRAYQASGRPEDFHEIVTRFAPLVFGECRRVTRNAHDAEDAAQLAFLALAIEIRAGTQVRSPAAWLQRVARRQALKIVRSRGRRKRREDAARRPEMTIDPPQPVDPAEQDALPALVRAAIDDLPDRYRLPLVLHYFGGMKLESIARELRLTKQAVGTRLHRGRKMLGEKLAAHDVVFDNGTLAAVVATVVPAAVIASLVRSTSTAVAAPTTLPSVTFAGGVSAMLNASFTASTTFCATRPIAAMIVVAGFAASTFAWSQPSTWIRPPAFRFNIEELLNRLLETPLPMPAFASGEADPIERPTLATLTASIPPVWVDRLDLTFASQSPAWFGDEWIASHSTVTSGPQPISPTITFSSLKPLAPPYSVGEMRLARVGPPVAPQVVVPRSPYSIRFDADPAALHPGRADPPKPSAVPKEGRSLTIDLDYDDGGYSAFLRSAAGAVDVESLFIGATSRGEVDYRGSRLSVGTLTIGRDAGSSGELRIDGSHLHITESRRPVIIADRGSGKLVLGGGDKPGRMTTTGTPIVVGATRESRGSIEGWGTIESHGTFTNNGKVIANGYGKIRALDLSGIKEIENSIENDRDGDRGWYAENGGELVLPDLTVRTGDSAVNWGESAADESPDLINSVRVITNGQQDRAKIRISLVSDPANVSTPRDFSLVSLWRLEVTDGTYSATSTEFVVRYDHVKANSFEGGEQNLLIYSSFDGNFWSPSANNHLDTDARQVSGSVHTSFRFFAVGTAAFVYTGERGYGIAYVGTAVESQGPANVFVSVVPEPGSTLAIGIAAALGRRRRRV